MAPQVTWGHKPHPNWGRKRPRPYLGRYTVCREPSAPGSAQKHPFVRYPYREQEPFHYPEEFELAGFTEDPVDQYLISLQYWIEQASLKRHQIYIRAGYITKPNKVMQYEERNTELWEEFDNLVSNLIGVHKGLKERGHNESEIPQCIINDWLTTHWLAHCR